MAVGLVDSPRPIRIAQFRPATVIQFGRVLLDPAPDGRVIHAEIALCHDLFQVPEAERIAQVPADIKDDDFRFEVSHFEQRRPLPFHASQSLSDRLNAVATHPVRLSRVRLDNANLCRRGLTGGFVDERYANHGRSAGVRALGHKARRDEKASASEHGNRLQNVPARQMHVSHIGSRIQCCIPKELDWHGLYANDAVAADPYKAKAFGILPVAYFKLDKHEQAAAALKSALALEPAQLNVKGVASSAVAAR